jgi:hypothetical protein
MIGHSSADGTRTPSRSLVPVIVSALTGRAWPSAISGLCVQPAFEPPSRSLVPVIVSALTGRAWPSAISGLCVWQTCRPSRSLVPGVSFRFDGEGVCPRQFRDCVSGRHAIRSFLFGAFYSVLSRSVGWCSMTLCSPIGFNQSSVVADFSGTTAMNLIRSSLSICIC